MFVLAAVPTAGIRLPLLCLRTPSQAIFSVQFFTSFFVQGDLREGSHMGGGTGGMPGSQMHSSGEQCADLRRVHLWAIAKLNSFD